MTGDREDYSIGKRMIPRNKPPVHPGEVLREEFLLPLGSVEELSLRVGVDPEDLKSVVDERASITRSLAEGLSKVFGTSRAFWLNLQEDWDKYWEERHDHEP